MYTYLRGKKSWGIAQHNRAGISNDFTLKVQMDLGVKWCMVLLNILSLTFRVFLNFWVGPWNSWLCHCIVTTTMQFSREYCSFVATQCVLLTSHQHTNGCQLFFFVYQTHVVVHTDVMSFVLTVTGKVTRKTMWLPSTNNPCMVKTY